MDVTNDPVVDWNPAWSPEGKFLYFASNRGGSMNIWPIPIDEKSGKILGDAQPITAPAQDVAHLRLSGDGEKIVFASIQGRLNLFKIQYNSKNNTVEGASTPVTRGNNRFIEVSVSPDGN